jgi:mannose-6-phosphate isomerase-like protein (cupin superfamily)
MVDGSSSCFANPSLGVDRIDEYDPMSDFVKSVFNEARFSNEKMMKVNLFETRNFFCDVYGLEPGQEQKLHSHADADKVYFVLEGEGTFHIGADAYQLSANQIVCAAAGVPHGVKNTSQGRLSVLVFMTPNPNVT